ncbi:MAG: hypothetical protein HQ582_04295, partial [Planctomycetes bacterium]|nr:hypothetical protein [Planctomycetota bacterium]
MSSCSPRHAVHTPSPSAPRIALFFGITVAMIVLLIAALGIPSARAGEPENEPDDEMQSVLRLAAVNTPQYTGLLDALLADFKKQTGLEVWVYSGKDIYQHARAGNVDLVISHYGKEGAESFVMEGYGLWPQTVFSNQAALIGPKNDPAKIRGLRDVGEAFRRIAETKSKYLVNNRPSVHYFTELLWEAAGRPEKGDWFVEIEAENVTAVEQAEKENAYIIYGAFPFLRYKELTQLSSEALVLGDPLLQRMMVSIVVNPKKIPGVHVDDARALQRYLVSPKAQAMVRNYRIPGSDAQLWWPAARHNNPDFLTGKTTADQTPPDAAAPGSGRGGGGGGGGGG